MQEHHRSHALTSNLSREADRGRPSIPTLAPQKLLTEFEKHVAAQHRLRAGPVTKASFSRAIGRTPPTLNSYLIGFNFPWPPVPQDRLVLLSEAESPYELLWVSQSLCDRLSFQADELLYRPIKEALQAGCRRVAESAQLAAELRADGSTVDHGDIPRLHLVAQDGRWLDVRAHVRYGRDSDTFYVQLELLGLPRDPTDEHAPVDVWNVKPGVRVYMTGVHDGESTVVRMDNIQTVLRRLREEQT